MICMAMEGTKSLKLYIGIYNFCLPDLDRGLMMGVTGQQGMLTPPKHPMVFPGVYVCLDFNSVWFLGFNSPFS